MPAGFVENPKVGAFAEKEGHTKAVRWYKADTAAGLYSLPHLGISLPAWDPPMFRMKSLRVL